MIRRFLTRRGYATLVASKKANVPLQDESIVTLEDVRKELSTLRLIIPSIPNVLSEEQLKEACQRRTRAKRLQFYRFLFAKEQFKLQRQSKKKATDVVNAGLSLQNCSHAADEHQYLESSSGPMPYFVPEQTIENLQVWQQASAYALGPTVVVDCSFLTSLTFRDLSLTQKQLSFMYALNRAYRRPARLVFAEIDFGSQQWNEFCQKYPINFEKTIAVETSSQRITELFPRDRIVYLSPDADTILDRVDEQTVYVIGALADKEETKWNWTLSKAAEMGVATAKLPIDQNVKWIMGKKMLPLNNGLYKFKNKQAKYALCSYDVFASEDVIRAVLGILLMTAVCGDWSVAIRSFIAKRRITPNPDRVLAKKQNEDNNLLTKGFLDDVLEIFHTSD